jgi:hypothetical protein
VNRDGGYAPIEVALGIGLLLLPVAVVVMSFGPWLESRVIAEAHGIDADDFEVGWCGAVPATEASGSCSFERGSSVTVEVRVWTPAITTPWGEVGGVWVSRAHSEPVDLYRSLG